MTPEELEGHRLAGARHGRICALIALEHLSGADAPTIERWLAHYQDVVLRDALAERLANGASALACSVFASGSVTALATDLNEAAELSRSLAAAVAGTRPPAA
ncbi:hypothetical protein ASG32_30710 [Methylobacterium sp. Leaf361]|uniref:hypothetical protein n=1 Tax=Methylobacterium sp. Leaf361 TaxID=1736352 RepID=UPI0006F85621|nr:hypothetical protein [Methylobacterium sp. Leaf361]KQS66499.1 hypothetical protein ASG32_30710 [Methylobacterium sp. Leaf361]